MWIAPPDDVKIHIFKTKDIYVTFNYHARETIGELSKTLNAPRDRYPAGNNVMGSVYTGEGELRADLYAAVSEHSWDRAASIQIILPEEYDYYLSLKNKAAMYLEPEEEELFRNQKPRHYLYEKKAFRKLMKEYHKNYERYIKMTYDKLIGINTTKQIDWE